jgi:ZIP family zinc transporter
VGEALLFGLIASSPLVFGSVLGTRVRLPKKVLASALAFASGSLITALAFELFIDSFEQGGAWISGLGMLAGAAVFVTISSWLDRRVEHPADPAGSPKMDTAAATQEPDFSPSAAGSAAGLALLAAAVLDGAPENLALGITLAEEGGGLVLLAAIFFNNFPEALVGAASLQESGRSSRFAILIWSATAVVLVPAVLIGRGLLVGSSPETISIPLAFAGGAVIASLADTLMPEAYEQGGPTVAFATAAGFFMSFLLSTLEA